MANQEMNKKLLSIAIPTYNRPEKLNKCLISILNQISDLVEIIVTDNSDNNLSSLVVDKLINETGVNINYYPNERNIGLDGNFYECIVKSNGKYVHWLSDDDELMPGSIEILLSLLSEIQYEKAFVFLNSIGFEENNDFRIWKRTWLKEVGKTHYNDVELALEEIGSDMTFVSSFCFQRESWLEVSTPEKHFGTNLYLTYTLMAYLGKFRNVYLLRTPIVAHRHDYTGNFHLLKPFTIELRNALVYYSVECGLNKQKLTEVYNKILSTLVFELILGIKCNYFVPRGKINYFRDIVLPCWKFSAFWKKLLPALVLPKFCYSIIRSSRKYLLRAF